MSPDNQSQEQSSIADESDVYIKSLAKYSSYVENILVHRLIASLAGELWNRDPNYQLNVFNPEVDNTGFDLVLACADEVRYVQVKQVHTRGAARKFSVRLEFAKMTGSCVIVVVYSYSNLEVEHFLFFGGLANEPMPNIENENASVSARGTDGEKKKRLHYRDVPRKRFQGPLKIGKLLDSLFSHDPATKEMSVSMKKNSSNR